jgi:membrane-bound inhibitor of C-type lysozyme
MSKTPTLIIAVVVVVLLFVGWEWRHSPLFSQFLGASGAGQLIAQVHYQCDGGKTIDAGYYQGAQVPQPVPGEPPVPTGSAKVALSDGRSLTLAQTLSADGARYASKDESFVFWSKGNGALVLENNQEKSFIGCVKVVDDPAVGAASLPQVYESGSDGISLRYPAGYAADAQYTYQALGPGKDISGVKFTIDPAIAQGTNLAADSYISVEELPNTECTADKFLDGSGPATAYSEGTMTYSYASTTGAGAGNRYEEQVFALPGTNPCVAVRYFVHYGVIENYPAGTVREFDRGALMAQFDAIRKTLVINQ